VQNVIPGSVNKKKLNRPSKLGKVVNVVLHSFQEIFAQTGMFCRRLQKFKDILSNFSATDNTSRRAMQIEAPQPPMCASPEGAEITFHRAPHPNDATDIIV